MFYPFVTVWSQSVLLIRIFSLKHSIVNHKLRISWILWIEVLLLSKSKWLVRRRLQSSINFLNLMTLSSSDLKLSKRFEWCASVTILPILDLIGNLCSGIEDNTRDAPHLFSFSLLNNFSRIISLNLSLSRLKEKLNPIYRAFYPLNLSRFYSHQSSAPQ